MVGIGQNSKRREWGMVKMSCDTTIFFANSVQLTLLLLYLHLFATTSQGQPSFPLSMINLMPISSSQLKHHKTLILESKCPLLLKQMVDPQNDLHILILPSLLKTPGCTNLMEDHRWVFFFFFNKFLIKILTGLRSLRHTSSSHFWSSTSFQHFSTPTCVYWVVHTTW